MLLNMTPEDQGWGHMKRSGMHENLWTNDFENLALF